VGKIPPKWRVPAGGWLKLNWDAALNMQSKRMGIGIVVRNEKGEFFPSINDPTIAEALAAWHAVNLCVDRGFQCRVGRGLFSTGLNS
jgi:phosphotransferase system IIA component